MPQTNAWRISLTDCVDKIQFPFFWPLEQVPHRLNEHFQHIWEGRDDWEQFLVL